MSPLEASSSALAERPKCTECGAYMEIRNGQTPEQRFCGTWYEHPQMPGAHIGHTSSVLYPSLQLITQLGTAT